MFSRGAGFGVVCTSLMKLLENENGLTKAS